MIQISEHLHEYGALARLCHGKILGEGTTGNIELDYENCLDLTNDFERMVVQNAGKKHYLPLIESLRDYIKQEFRKQGVTQ